MNRALPGVFVLAGLLAGASPATAQVSRSANDGNLILEGIPEIPPAVVADLNRYQNVRSATFLDWSEGGNGLYIATRFGDVNQLHRVDMPGGARHQITFFNEPINGARRQPGGGLVAFTMDAGGNEFSQIFLLDPADGNVTMLSDGQSRNSQILWDHQGRRIAYQSTRRNGAANDIWLMDVDEPLAARIALESPDGSWWAGIDFDDGGRQLLVLNYVSAADSRAHVLDLASGERRLVAGSESEPSVNLPIGFDRDATGVWLLTDAGGEFQQLAWTPLAAGSRPTIVSGDIPWSVDAAAISHDRRRGAFAVNEDGLSRLYLIDLANRDYAQVANLPTGVAADLTFSADDRRLALTLNTPKTPSDSFVLELGERPLEHGALTRWTFSEVGGLDTDRFVEPELIRYPSFDTVDGAPRPIPAWVYKPPGAGPFPVVISIHGGPEAQARPTFSSTYQMWLEKLGAAVIEPNVRGSDGYGKTYLSLDNDYRREDSVKDIGALLDWIAAQPDLDAERVAVFGGSYGGYMVLASAVHYSARLRAAIDVVGISNFVSFLANTEDYRRDLRRVEYGDERDPAMRAHLESISPLNHVARIAVPMLVVQGQNDPRVPVSEAAQIVQALRARGQPVWYMNALNEGHGYRRKDNRDVYQQAVVLFLREHLLGAD